MDKILIEDLLVRCVIGVFPEERHRRQDVILNITLWADLAAAGVSDDLADTVDYKALKGRIVSLVEASSFALLEKLAAEVSRVCLEVAQVDRVMVRIDKPGALSYARSVAVEIERGRA